MNNTNAEYPYIIKGQRVKYSPMVDYEPEECTKLFHDFVNESSRVVMTAEFSPYTELTDSVIRNWIAAGCPGRKEIVHPEGWISSCTLSVEDFK